MILCEMNQSLIIQYLYKHQELGFNDQTWDLIGGMMGSNGAGMFSII